MAHHHGLGFQRAFGVHQRYWIYARVLRRGAAIDLVLSLSLHARNAKFGVQNRLPCSWRWAKPALPNCDHEFIPLIGVKYIPSRRGV